MLSLRRQAPVSSPIFLREETSEMSVFRKERSAKSAVTREQVLKRLAEIIDDVARWQPGQHLKERVNDAASALGLSPSRADDLMRLEARRTDAEEYLNVLERYEAWLSYEEKRLASFGRARREQLKTWRARNGLGGENTSTNTADDSAADSAADNRGGQCLRKLGPSD